MIQLLGFGGSSLIILSVTMGSFRKLRIMGLMGSLTFIGYGIALGAWPVVATNIVTSLVHLHHLRLLARSSAEPGKVERVDVQPATAPVSAPSMAPTPVGAGAAGLVSR